MIQTVRAFFANFNANAMPRGVVAFLLARAELPLAHRRDDLQRRVQDPRRHLEAHLVVALAGAAVRNRPGALAMRDIDQMLSDERARQRGGQQGLALVDGVRLERWDDVVT